MQKLKHFLYPSSNTKPETKTSMEPNNNQPTHYLPKDPDHTLHSAPLKTSSCPDCLEKITLISKYDGLIKLLKIKISKLQKQLQNIPTPKQNPQIYHFQTFKMELESQSIHTTQILPENPPLPFKEIQLGSVIAPQKRKSSFNQTHVKSLRLKTKKQQKKVKKSPSQNQTFEKDLENHLQVPYKTQKFIDKIKNEKGLTLGWDLGKEISFSHLMQKSIASLQSPKKFFWRSQANEECISSIKTMSYESDVKTSNEVTKWLKEEKKAISNQKASDEENKRFEMLQKRIMFMTETILELKTFLLHVRQGIQQFVKMTDTVRLKNKEQESSYMLGVLIKIFEYSQEEMEEMFKKEKKNKEFFGNNLAKTILAKIAR